MCPLYCRKTKPTVKKQYLRFIFGLGQFCAGLKIELNLKYNLSLRDEYQLKGKGWFSLATESHSES